MLVSGECLYLKFFKLSYPTILVSKRVEEPNEHRELGLGNLILHLSEQFHLFSRYESLLVRIEPCVWLQSLPVHGSEDPAGLYRSILQSTWRTRVCVET